MTETHRIWGQMIELNFNFHFPLLIPVIAFKSEKKFFLKERKKLQEKRGQNIDPREYYLKYCNIPGKKK